MIAIFDEDGGGDVDFQEFVSGLSAFSSKGNKEEKLRFAFKVYDIDRDGYISNGELFIVLKMMVGSNLKDMQLQQVCFSSPRPTENEEGKGDSFEGRSDGRLLYFLDTMEADDQCPTIDCGQDNHGGRHGSRWEDQFRRVHEDG